MILKVSALVAVNNWFFLVLRQNKQPRLGDLFLRFPASSNFATGPFPSPWSDQ